MEEFIATIANVGFPIAVAAYLLIRVEGKLCELTIAITELRQAIIVNATLKIGQIPVKK